MLRLTIHWPHCTVRLSSEHPSHSAHTSEYCCLYTPGPEIWISLLDPVFLLLQGYGIWYIALLIFVNASIRKQGSYPALFMAFPSYMVRCLMDRKAPRQPCLPLRPCHVYPIFTQCPFLYLVLCRIWAVLWLRCHTTEVKIPFLACCWCHDSLASNVPKVSITVVLLESFGICGDKLAL